MESLPGLWDHYQQEHPASYSQSEQGYDTEDDIRREVHGNVLVWAFGICVGPPLKQQGYLIISCMQTSSNRVLMDSLGILLEKAETDISRSTARVNMLPAALA
jgi:hypothetical protein